MAKCALITHFTGLSSPENFIYYPFFGLLSKLIPQFFLKQLIRYLPPHKILSVRNIISENDSETSGYAIMCPLLPEHFITLNKELVVKKVIASCELAERLGAQIVGLAAFTSIVGNEGEEVAKSVNIGVTSGNTYTAFLAVDGLLKAAELFSVDKISAKLVILGATGDIGSICAKMLSKQFSNITLVGRDRNKLKEIKELLSNNQSVQLETNVRNSIAEADLILCVASSIIPLFEINVLKQGAIVCDVSIPPAVPKTENNFRKDVFIFDGGKAMVTTNNRIIGRKWHKLFPDGVIYGCLAETILLALEEKIENFSIGRGCITEEKIDIISNLAKKHGFITAPFKFGKYIYTDEDFKRIKNLITKRKE